MDGVWTLLLIMFLVLFGGPPQASAEDDIATITKSAENGDAGAQWKLGRLYYNFECDSILDKLECVGVSQDPAKAAEWYLKAAEQGNADAQFLIGSMYIDGKGVPNDMAKSFYWLKKAAGQGHAFAYLGLGMIHKEGLEVPKDVAKGAELIQKGLMLMQQQAEKGSINAYLTLGMLYDDKQILGPRDVIKAADCYQKAAEKGSLTAHIKLGVTYAKGEGVPKDTTKADEWFQKAAMLGGTAVQIKFAKMYDEGTEIPKDEVKAMEWYLNAAEQGDKEAQFLIGGRFLDGRGVLKDMAKADKWYQKAAVQGGMEMQRRIGDAYEFLIHFGSGAYSDSVDNKAAIKAVEWHQKAAEQGDASAQTSLGNLYQDGEGVAKSASKAVEWYQKAAAQGNASAQGFLGFMFKEGKGMPQDLVLAVAWFNLAASHDGQVSELMKTKRDRLSEKISPAQRAEAELLSSSWKKGELLTRGRNAKIADSNGKPPKSSGTAFRVTRDGYAITNHHVAGECKDVRMQNDKKSIQVIATDPVSDLTLLKMPDSTQNVCSLAPDNLRQGQDIVVFGFPLNQVLSSGGNLTPGVVSAISGLGNNSSQFQITASIQPGSSGSAVMDKKGFVVGVVNMKLSDTAMVKNTGTLPQNVNFAVNGQTLKSFLDANHVPYKVGNNFFSREKSLADMGDQARQWTTVVECWN